MSAIAFIAFHVVTAGTKGQDVGATVVVGFEAFISWFDKSDKVEDVALTAGDFGNDVITPKDKPGDATND